MGTILKFKIMDMRIYLFIFKFFSKKRNSKFPDDALHMLRFICDSLLNVV